MFAGKIGVAKGFQTSVNIAYDLNNDDKVRGFIPTQSSLDVIEDILLSTAPTAAQRARILIGAYGRGKSHIILVLLSLLSGKDEILFTALLNKMDSVNPELASFAREYLQSGKKLLLVVVRGSSSSLSSSFLNALQLTLNDEGLSDIMPETHFQAAVNAIDNWRENFPDTYSRFVSALSKPAEDFVISLKEYDTNSYSVFSELYPQLTSGSAFNPFLGFDITELYESIAKKVESNGYDGVFVVYDEFSKYLESSIANATISDIKMLQDFAEKCDRSGELQMHLLLICHKDIANYIDGGLPKEKVDGWRGVSGRFKHLNLHNNYVQMYEIITAVIRKEPKWWNGYKSKNRAMFDELKHRFTGNRLLDSGNISEIENAVFGCYPLHPISTFILPRLSERVAQNERTLFTFLSTDNKYTLPSFLDSADDAFPLLTPDYLYDYFEPLLRKEPYTSEAHKLYKLTTAVLQKVEGNTLGAKILKTIALIYLVEQFEKLPPIVDIISDTFRDSVDDVMSINDALTELIEKECVVYLKRSNNYLKLKESSGVDIPGEITSLIESKRAVLSVKDILNNSAFDSYMYPTRYNDEYEITRYFDFTFISGSDFWSVDNWDAFIEGREADGVVFAVIPETDADTQKIKSAICEDACASDRVVFILPNKYEDIEKIAFDYYAVRWLRLEAAGDDLLADEYDIYLDDLTEVIGAYISSFSRPENGAASYFYCSEQRHIFRRAQMTELLSKICRTIFHRTPVINNESVNKNTLPTMAIKSRTKLLSGLLANELAPNLGLTGTGQDVSFMRSTLIQPGILIDAETDPKLNLTPDNERVASMLDTIRGFLRGAGNNGGSGFRQLYDELTLPQYGIGLKRGLIPIYIAAVLSGEKQNLVVLYRNNEIRITPDLLNDINESPDDYSVILENWNEEKADYMAGLERIFGEYVTEREKSYNGFAFILYAMNRWYMNLPKYAKEMDKRYVGNGEFDKLDSQRKRFINSLKQLDMNPREFLLEKVFKVFAMEFSPNILAIIEETKTEWDNAVSNLIGRLGEDVKVTFGQMNNNGSLASIVKDWYESLSEQTLQYLFAGNENRILRLMSSVPNDESTFVQRLAKAVTSLRIEDWNAETIKVFRRDLTRFKTTVDDFSRQKHGEAESGTDLYTITFTGLDGDETMMKFKKTIVSKRAKLLMNEITTSLEEMGQALTIQEKRQVLIELLEQLC
ncbi:MAG: hypothetical protein LBE89_04655 [Helicobacteraceae bacterium]|jgi:hypothetical protein|nr:hypothetical protein [Helicobacteraceae bacterium]